MSERFSIKGKGAELFFGAGERRELEPQPESESPDLAATQTASQPASLPAAQPPGQQATLPPSAQDTMSAPTPPAGIEASIRDRLRQQLEQDHPLHLSYRFAREEIDALRDIVYELEVKRDLRITRNDIIRVGLNWVIDDYRAHGKDSLLMLVLREERWKP